METKMRAVTRDWGKFVFKETLSAPQEGPDTVLVRIKAAAINPVDYKLPSIILGSIVGLDFSGVIESTGKNVTTFAVGDEVYGKVNGSLAEFALAKPDDISLKPKNLSHAEAAAIPLTYQTSLQALRNFGALKEGGRVLIIGASGGCGIAALQLAKYMRAGNIVAVCSGKNADMVRSHGADDVIDYKQHDLLEYFQQGSSKGKLKESAMFDVIYDAASGSGAGEDYKSRSIQLLCNENEKRAHGQYVAINGGVDLWMRQFTIGQKRNQHLVMYNNNSTDLKYLSKLFEDGFKNENGEDVHLVPVLDSFLPFNSENVVKGFDILKSRRATGKIVLDMSIEK